MKFKKAKQLFDKYNTEWADSHTYAHGIRVMQNSMKVCEELGIKDINATYIQLAARYHDIGKIKYPSDLLGEKKIFTKKEMKTFMNHVKYGYDILKGFYGDDNIASLVLYHHERIDGSGYLKGLKGEEIPLGSRIITVCDAYDAMFRHYTLKTEEQAIEELKKNKGKCFDEKVVDAFLKIIQSSK
ncbi:MAG: HD domain-containing protein [Nanoarchaeota archaeon]|nr:HD domain-containing protein [Nanoarchaeota archaeon]